MKSAGKLANPLTEDKDFGLLAYAGGKKSYGWQATPRCGPERAVARTPQRACLLVTAGAYCGPEDRQAQLRRIASLAAIEPPC